MRQIILKPSKDKEKESILKTARKKKRTCDIKGIPIKLAADFYEKQLKAEGSGITYSKC